jgi:hypothetical protein
MCSWYLYWGPVAAQYTVLKTQRASEVQWIRSTQRQHATKARLRVPEALFCSNKRL